MSEQQFETADSQAQVGKQRFASKMNASNWVEARRKARQYGCDHFGEREFHLEIEAVPGSALVMRYVVVSEDSERVAIESPTWW